MLPTDLGTSIILASSRINLCRYCNLSRLERSVPFLTSPITLVSSHDALCTFFSFLNIVPKASKTHAPLHSSEQRAGQSWYWVLVACEEKVSKCGQVPSSQAEDDKELGWLLGHRAENLCVQFLSRVRAFL